MSYAPLQHSAWNGLTLCDLVFPFFLFIMGISTYISLNKFNFNVSLQVVTKILKRTFLILCIGWTSGWFDHVCEGDFLPFVHLRIPGVLQRIALCYCVISFTALFMNHKFIPALTFILLVHYPLVLRVPYTEIWLWLLGSPVPPSNQSDNGQGNYSQVLHIPSEKQLPSQSFLSEV